MTGFQLNGDEGHDDVLRRLTDDIAARLDEHVQRRIPRPHRPAPRHREEGLYSGNRVHYVVNQPHATISAGTGTMYAGSPGVSAEVQDVVQALRAVLEQLPDAGLSRRCERAVRRQADAALQEAQAVQPQPRRLRRLVHEVSIALVTSIASGGANPMATALVERLQQVPF